MFVTQRFTFKSFLIFSLGSLAVARADVPMIFINHHALKPGQTLMVQCPKRDNYPPSLTWGDSVFKFRETPDHMWRVLVPVPLDRSAQQVTLYINVQYPTPNDPLEGPLDFEVLPADFGKEDLEFSAEKSKLLNDKAEEDESVLIREMVKGSISDPEQRWRGLFSAPVPGKILSKFGLERNKKGQNAADIHKGIDMAAKAGDPVLAPNGGIVLLVKEFYFHGKTVLISHGQGVATIYIHLSSFSVKEGDLVKQGQKLGEVGSSGLATGPHLHWGLYVLGQPVDPEQWLAEGF